MPAYLFFLQVTFFEKILTIEVLNSFDPQVILGTKNWQDKGYNPLYKILKMFRLALSYVEGPDEMSQN